MTWVLLGFTGLLFIVQVVWNTVWNRVPAGVVEVVRLEKVLIAVNRGRTKPE